MGKLNTRQRIRGRSEASVSSASYFFSFFLIESENNVKIAVKAAKRKQKEKQRNRQRQKQRQTNKQWQSKKAKHGELSCCCCCFVRLRCPNIYSLHCVASPADPTLLHLSIPCTWEMAECFVFAYRIKHSLRRKKICPGAPQFDGFLCLQLRRKLYAQLPLW